MTSEGAERATANYSASRHQHHFYYRRLLSPSTHFPGYVLEVLTMTQTKDKHYWTQLRSALTSGAWGSSAPAKAYNGTPTSWPELFRKFNKHNHGFTEVVEIASQTQALALQIAGGTADTDLDGEARRRSGPLALDEECIVDEGRRDEARAGFETLKKLESGSPRSDVRLSLCFMR